MNICTVQNLILNIISVSNLQIVILIVYNECLYVCVLLARACHNSTKNPYTHILGINISNLPINK